MKLGLGIGLNRFQGGQGGALLDSYKGSAFAMSPDTLLYSSYSATDDIFGSVTNGDTGQFSVAILRDSDNAVRSFTPAEVADGTANTWVQAAGAANGFVRRAYDQSVTALDVSNLNHADQSDPTKMPKLFDSSTGLILENGKAAIEFDGVDDFLSLTSTINNAGTETIFTVCNSSSTLVSRGILRFNTNTYYRLSDFQGGVDYSYGFPAKIFSFSSLATQKLIAAISASNVKSVWRNGVGSADNTITDGSSSTSINRISSSSLSYDGTLQELIIYPSDQSTNRTAIESALNDYYEIY